MSTRTPFPHQSVQSSNLALRNSTEMTYSSVCLHGKTSNGNESFNNVLWRIALKSEFSGLTTLKLSVYTAVLLYNNGASGMLNVLSEQGLKVGTFGMLGAERRARARVSIANYQDKPQVKSRRHTLKKDARHRRKFYCKKGLLMVLELSNGLLLVSRMCVDFVLKIAYAVK